MKQTLTTTFNIEEKELQVLKDAANFLLDFNQACNEAEKSAKIVFENIDVQILANLLECFVSTSTAIGKILNVKTVDFNIDKEN